MINNDNWIAYFVSSKETSQYFSGFGHSLTVHEKMNMTSLWNEYTNYTQTYINASDDK